MDECEAGDPASGLEAACEPDPQLPLRSVVWLREREAVPNGPDKWPIEDFFQYGSTARRGA